MPTTCPTNSISYDASQPEKATAIPVLYQSYYHVLLIKLLFVLFIFYSFNLLVPGSSKIINLLAIIINGIITFLHPSLALFLYFITIIYYRVKYPNDMKFKLPFMI